MKKLLIILILSAGCGPSSENCNYSPPEKVNKCVKSKHEGQETTYSYKYNIFKGNFYHQPNIHTVYYITFTDATTIKVKPEQYFITEPGDSISTWKR